MRRFFTPALFVVLVFAIVLPAAALAAENSDRSAIEKQIALWLDGYNTGNIAKINEVFSPDLIFMTSGTLKTMGRDSIARAYQEQFSKYRCHMVGITDEIQISGDMAYDRGRFTMTLQPKAGGAKTVFTGQFLETWKKGVDNAWRITRLANIQLPTTADQ